MSLKIITKSYNKYVLIRVHTLKGQILIKSNFPDSVEIKIILTTHVHRW